MTGTRYILSDGKSGIGMEKKEYGRAANLITSNGFRSGGFVRRRLGIKSGPGKCLQFLSRVCTINVKELGSASARKHRVMIGCG